MKKSWATEIKGYRRKKLMKLTASFLKSLWKNGFKHKHKQSQKTNWGRHLSQM